MTPQPPEPTRDEVRAQLALILGMLETAETHCAELPGDLRAQVEAMPEERAHEQFAALAALLPPATRARTRAALSVTLDWLAEPVSPPGA